MALEGSSAPISQEPDSYIDASPSEPLNRNLLSPEWRGATERRCHERPDSQSSSHHADGNLSSISLSPDPNRSSISFSPNPTLLASPSSRPGSLKSSPSSTSLGSSPQGSTRHAIHGHLKTGSSASLASRRSGRSLREGQQVVAHNIHPDFPSPPLGVSSSETAPFVHTTCPPPATEPSTDTASMRTSIYSRPPVDLVMTYPSALERYKRTMPTIQPNDEKASIPAKTFNYTRTTTNVPHGWAKYIHPEGTIYYYHKEKKTYTDLNICKSGKAEIVEWFAEFLWFELAEDRKKYELVLDFSTEEGSDRECCYYFVNRAKRCLFWLDDFDEPGFLANCKGVDCLSHSRFAVEAQYWYGADLSSKSFINVSHHWEYFPSSCKVNKTLLGELKSLVLYSTLGHLTETRTVGSFTVTSAVESTLQQLEKYASLVDGIDVANKAYHDHFAVIIGRLMSYFCKHKFNNFYEQDCVRLRDDQTVYGWTYEPSWRMIILAPLLFMAPITNIRSLHRLYVDCLVRRDKWIEFLNDFKAQLDRTNLLATVLLSTNVGFLAIQSVDSYFNRSGREILSYFSIVASLTSIVLGLIFTERSRHDRTVSISRAADSLRRFHHPKHGLETLAFVFSLPFAYLMWGILFFFAAFSAECYNVGVDSLRGFIGGFIIFMVIPAALSVWLSRDLNHPWWWQAELQETVSEEDGAPSISALSLLSLGERGGAVILNVWASVKTYIPRLRTTRVASNDVGLYGHVEPPSPDVENQPTSSDQGRRHGRPMTPVIHIRQATLGP